MVILWQRTGWNFRQFHRVLPLTLLSRLAIRELRNHFHHEICVLFSTQENPWNRSSILYEVQQENVRCSRTSTNDWTAITFYYFIWLTIELNTSIIAACLPTLAPLKAQLPQTKSFLLNTLSFNRSSAGTSRSRNTAVVSGSDRSGPGWNDISSNSTENITQKNMVAQSHELTSVVLPRTRYWNLVFGFAHFFCCRWELIDDRLCS
jgi:hypothetical protein